MPAKSVDAFEAFFNHSVRLRWDTLLRVNYVEGGGTHPYLGAISTNRGRGWKTGLTMSGEEWRRGSVLDFALYLLYAAVGVLSIGASNSPDWCPNPKSTVACP